nr:LuxR family transcriptional regulator [Spelaeicoccus albus]
MAAVSGPTATGPPLVGRTVECRLFAELVDAAAASTPSVLLLRGSAGVGKTRLAREALAAAGAADFTALSGRADEIAKHVTFSPIVEALSPVIGTMPPNDRRALGRRLPQLALVFDGLGVPAPSPVADGALERRRIIEGVAHLIESTCAANPVALMIDDIQFADDLTLMLLAHLSRMTTRLLLICAVTADDDLRTAERLLASYRSSAWHVEIVDVAPLSARDSATLFNSVARTDIAETTRTAAVANCGGIPFYLEAMAEHLTAPNARDGAPPTDGSLPLPVPVNDELQLRLRSLTPDARAVAELLAVDGGGCSFRTLLACSSLGRTRQASALAELERRHLLSSDPGDTYSLAHGLLRSAALAGMTRTDVYRRHAAFAGALAASDPGDVRAAEHIIRAGPVYDSRRALPVLVHAARRARGLGSADDAIKYFRAALACAEEMRRDGHCAAIHDQLTVLSEMTLQPDDARRHAAAALALYTERHDDAGIGRAELAHCRLAWSAGDVNAALAHLDAAGRAQARLAPSESDLDLLSLQVSVASRLGDVEGIATAAKRMRALAHRFPSPDLTASAQIATAIDAFTRTDYARAVSLSEDAAVTAGNGTDPALTVRAYDQLSLFALGNGDLEKSVDATERSLATARSAGASLLEAWPRLRLAIVDLLSGSFEKVVDECLELCRLAERYDERRGSVNILATLALAQTRLGRLDDAAAAIDRAGRLGPESLYTDVHTTAPLNAARTALDLAAGEYDAAAAHGAALCRLGTGAYPLVGAALYGEALWRSGRPHSAAELAGDVHRVLSCSTPLASAVASWIDGLADSDGTQALRQAAAGFETVGLPYWRVASLLADAERSPRAAAIESATTALDVADRVRLPAEAQRARALLRAHGVVPSRGRRHDSSLFSPREREIAALAAAGHPTSTIATRLYISPRTVTTHLERIYAKAGVHSRIALAQFMTAAGPSEPAADATSAAGADRAAKYT